MKYIHIPTFIIFGVSIFCISTAHFELANAIQYCWTGTFVILILTYSLSMACMGKRIMLPKDKIMKTVCVLGIIEILYSIIQLFGFVPNNFHYAYFSGSLNNPAIFGMLLFIVACGDEQIQSPANDNMENTEKKEEPEKEDSLTAMTYSKSKNLSAFLSKVSASAESVTGTPIDQLEKRLALLKY